MPDKRSVVNTKYSNYETTHAHTKRRSEINNVYMSNETALARKLKPHTDYDNPPSLQDADQTTIHPPDNQLSPPW